MAFKLLTQPVGPYSMNTYVIINEATQTSAIVDPGGDPDKILEMAAGTKVEKILITHGHGDHIMALDDIKDAADAPVYIHPADAYQFKIEFDELIEDGEAIPLGNLSLKVIHAPGHTPGQCCFDLGDGRIVVGDTVFVNGPGATQDPKSFQKSIKTMRTIVFSWPDDTEFLPGHGPSGTIGEERPKFEAFLSKGWSEDTCGDVTWE